MPYRIDVANPPADALDRLVSLGALDVGSTEDGIAALLPDAVEFAQVVALLGPTARVSASPAIPRDDGSIWILEPREVRAGPLRIVPADAAAAHDAVKLLNAAAFGTGLHPTTTLSLEMLERELTIAPAKAVLDVGTGSGILALAALRWGAAAVVAVDVDRVAVETARGNARLNGLAAQLRLVHGGPEALFGSWPLVVANILAAPLIEMAPTLVRRVAGGGRVILSGIADAAAPDVAAAYRRLGMRELQGESRAGWRCLLLSASW